MEDQTCKNCKYYMPHYVKLLARFQQTPTGHCACPDMTKLKPRNPHGLLKNCPLWEQAEDLSEKRTKTIETMLANMEAQLNDIKEILRTDRQV